jgi:hypothetical protein
MRMFLGALLATGVLSLTIVPSALYAQVSDDKLIVPGKSVGAITLGMSAAEVLQILGDPDRSNDSTDPSFPGAKFYAWNPTGREITVAIDRLGVVRIIAFGKQFATSDGIAVGVSDLRVRSVLGEPSKLLKFSENQTYQYRTLGLWMRLTLDGRVTEIDVEKPW